MATFVYTNNGHQVNLDHVARAVPEVDKKNDDVIYWHLYSAGHDLLGIVYRDSLQDTSPVIPAAKGETATIIATEFDKDGHFTARVVRRSRIVAWRIEPSTSIWFHQASPVLREPQGDNEDVLIEEYDGEFYCERREAHYDNIQQAKEHILEQVLEERKFKGLPLRKEKGPSI
jgi:hypothetical protein